VAEVGGAPHRGLEELVAAQRAAFRDHFARSPSVTASAPGRINVIGEHTDYNEGLALPGAIDRWIVASLSPRDDGLLRVHSEAFAETREARLADAAAAEGWSSLIAGVGALFAGLSGAPRGFDALIGGDLPMGAGLSSSAAVEMALLNGLRALTGAAIGDLELVRTAQRVEHEQLGVATGLMDQYASQFARPAALLLIDFRSLTHEVIACPLDGWAWMLIDSGVRHRLADSAYDDRVAESRRALEAVGPRTSGERSLRRVATSAIDGIEEPLLRRRLRHLVSENARVREAVAAVAGGTADELGRLLLASHASLRDDYEVSCDELDRLVDAAAAQDGCVGARMMGGGFGGCTLNLVRDDAVDAVAAAVGADFHRRFGRVPAAAAYRLVAGAAVHA